MVSLGRCYIFGLLFVVVGASLSYWEDDLPEEEEVCITVTLSSTLWTVDKKPILNEKGDPVDITRVEVIKQHSDVKCKLGRTYFILQSAVTAKKGCSGKFKVCYTIDAEIETVEEPEELPVSPGCVIIRLLSRVNRKAKKVLESRVSSMKVARQFKEGVTCVKNTNYGFKDRLVFAKGSCRADFEVCFDNDDDDEEKGCSVIVLESWGPGEPDFKKFPISSGDRITVKLIKQLSGSDAPCINGKTYFVKGNKVTVIDGCRGKFRVCVNSDPWW